MGRVDHALILAAGSGSRLNGSVNGSAKCLVQVGGRSLIEHQLNLLSRFGIERVTVVVGHDAGLVRARLDGRCGFVENPRYTETNSLYSLHLASAAVDGPFVLMNCDVLAHPQVLGRVLASGGCALAYDSGSGAEPEHMKVEVVGGRLCSVSKRLPRARTGGENVGILRFDAEGGRALLAAAHRLLAAGKEREWAPAAVDAIAPEVDVRCVDVCDLAWGEVDFPEDLRVARERVWPEVQRALSAWRLAPGRRADGGRAAEHRARDAEVRS